MIRLLLVTLAAIVVVLAFFWLVQRQMMYFPAGDVLTPAQAGLPQAERVSFRTDDGMVLHGWFVPAARRASEARRAERVGVGPHAHEETPAADDDGTTVIVFNGNAGNRSYRADLAGGLARAGLAVLLFDYRGYGENEGAPSEGGLLLDARAARRYVDGRADVRADRVVYFGESLGSGVAVSLAAERRPLALVLRSPFTSMVDTAKFHYPFLPVRLLLRDRYESIRLIDRVGCPVAVIAAAHDSIVPTALSRRLYEAAREPKRLVIVEGADHNDLALVAGPLVIEAVLAAAKSG
jgi:pimeloyl-ACP methyl ester carboxylesterase